MIINNMFVLYTFGIKCSFMFIDIALICCMESESDDLESSMSVHHDRQLVVCAYNNIIGASSYCSNALNARKVFCHY